MHTALRPSRDAALLDADAPLRGFCPSCAWCLLAWLHCIGLIAVCAGSSGRAGCPVRWCCTCARPCETASWLCRHAGVEGCRYLQESLLAHREAGFLSHGRWLRTELCSRLCLQAHIRLLLQVQAMCSERLGAATQRHLGVVLW